jgi:hypothetical protein
MSEARRGLADGLLFILLPRIAHSVCSVMVGVSAYLVKLRRFSMTKLTLDFDSIPDFVKKIRLRGGVVGKTAYIVIFAILSLAVIALSVRDVWISGMCAAMVFILVLVIGVSMLRFAERNPQAAILEGAEFLLHQQMTIGMKGNPEIPANPRDDISDPSAPQILLPPSEQADELPPRLEGSA